MVTLVINYLAVLVASIIQIILGALWYSPVLFVKPWLNSIGKSMPTSKPKGMAMSYIGMIVSTLIMNYILAHFIQYAGATDVVGGLLAGFWIWLGFVATTSLGLVLWEKRSVKWYVITTGYYLIALLISGVILAVWA